MLFYFIRLKFKNKLRKSCAIGNNPNGEITFGFVVVLPQFPITEPHSYFLTPALSPVGWGGQSEGKRQKLVGWNENSLTTGKGRRKQQSIILIKSMYNMQCSHHPTPSLLLSSKSLSFSQLPT